MQLENDCLEMITALRIQMYLTHLKKDPFQAKIEYSPRSETIHSRMDDLQFAELWHCRVNIIL
jgi:hypothetical protein